MNEVPLPLKGHAAGSSPAVRTIFSKGNHNPVSAKLV
jgi:hypothetical protein